MLIRHIMTHQDLVTVSMDHSVAEVQKLFEKHNFHHLLVVQGGSVRGVISDRDLLKNISPFIDKMAERPQDVATLQRRVHQIMTREPISVGPDTKIEEAAQTMLRNKVSCLPVIDPDTGSPLGIVTWRDLLCGLCGIAKSELEQQGDTTTDER